MKLYSVGVMLFLELRIGGHKHYRGSGDVYF